MPGAIVNLSLAGTTVVVVPGNTAATNVPGVCSSNYAVLLPVDMMRACLLYTSPSPRD